MDESEDDGVMGDFFKAGERYRNRKGEYEVVEVRTPLLLIRYTDTGRLQEVEEGLQERIVRNLRREEELAAKPPEERKPAAERASRARKRLAKFEGFAEADFLGKTAGTTWRAKSGLGGLLADLLAEHTGEPFDSWTPNRQTVVYLCSPEDSGTESLHDSAQYFVQTSDQGLQYGLMLQRPKDAAEGATAWDRFMGVLSDDDTAASTLNDLLTQGTVELSWYGETWGSAQRETVRADDDGLVLERAATTETDTIEGVIERLGEAPQDEALILTIESSVSVQDAIAAGPTVVETIVELFDHLAGLYRATSG